MDALLETDEKVLFAANASSDWQSIEADIWPRLQPPPNPESVRLSVGALLQVGFLATTEDLCCWFSVERTHVDATFQKLGTHPAFAQRTVGFNPKTGRHKEKIQIPIRPDGDIPEQTTIVYQLRPIRITDAGKRHLQTLSEEKRRSRFEAFRNSFECLCVLLDFLHRSPDRLTGGEFLAISDSAGHKLGRFEEADYAAAWQKLAPQFSRRLNAPSLFGHENVGSFHELVTAISCHVLEALHFDPCSSHPWPLAQLIERCRDPRALPRSIQRAERYRGWNPDAISLMLKHEAGQVRLQESGKTDPRTMNPRVVEVEASSGQFVLDGSPVYEFLPKLFLRQVIGDHRGGGSVDHKTLIPALHKLGIRLHPDHDTSSRGFDLQVDVSSLSGLPKITEGESRATELDNWRLSGDNKKGRIKSKLGTKFGTKPGKSS